MEHLSGKDYKVTARLPLFPRSRSNPDFDDKTLQNRLQKFFKKQPFGVSLEKIRQSGVCDFYDEMRQRGLSAHDCLKKTMAFAKSSKSQTLGIIDGNIQRTGEKRNVLLEYAERIGLEIDPLNKYRKAHEILRLIDSDEHLSARKRNILRELTKKEIRAVKDQPPPIPPKKRRPRPIANVIKFHGKTK